MTDIFVSHVEEDSVIALEIVAGLEEAGYTTWSYEIDSVPGPSYLVQTGEAVETSKIVIVVISPDSLGSRQVTSEIVRAHESSKKFVPVLHGITHAEFQNRQPEWREALGAAASIRIPQEGVAAIIPRIINGLKILDILPGSKVDSARIRQIHSMLDELQGRSTSTKTELQPAVDQTQQAEPVTTRIEPAEAAEEAPKRRKWIKPTVIASIAIVIVAALSIIVPYVTRQSDTGSNVPDTSKSKLTEEPVILFSDDFESGELTEWDIANINGEIKISEKNGNSFLESTNFAHATVGDPSWTDYELKARFTILDGLAIVHSRRQTYKTDQGNLVRGYTLVLLPDRIVLRKGEGLEGVTGQSAVLTSTTVQIEEYKWHTLTLTCQGNEFFVDIDSESLLFFEDNEGPVLSGVIALGSLPNSHAFFDDIKVQENQPREEIERYLIEMSQITNQLAAIYHSINEGNLDDAQENARKARISQSNIDKGIDELEKQGTDAVQIERGRVASTCVNKLGKAADSVLAMQIKIAETRPLLDRLSEGTKEDVSKAMDALTELANVIRDAKDAIQNYLNYATDYYGMYPEDAKKLETDTLVPQLQKLYKQIEAQESRMTGWGDTLSEN
ncbi:toll/interleukin-1 receptor domain-containing protein [Chloroflexota bacterium]